MYAIFWSRTNEAPDDDSGARASLRRLGTGAVGGLLGARIVLNRWSNGMLFPIPIGGGHCVTFAGLVVSGFTCGLLCASPGYSNGFGCSGAGDSITGSKRWPLTDSLWPVKVVAREVTAEDLFDSELDVDRCDKLTEPVGDCEGRAVGCTNSMWSSTDPLGDA